MDSLNRFQDAMDEAHGELPSSLKRVKEIRDLQRAQLLELVDDKIAYFANKMNLELEFIPAQEELEITFPNEE